MNSPRSAVFRWPQLCQHSHCPTILLIPGHCHQPQGNLVLTAIPRRRSPSPWQPPVHCPSPGLRLWGRARRWSAASLPGFLRGAKRFRGARVTAAPLPRRGSVAGGTEHRVFIRSPAAGPLGRFHPRFMTRNGAAVDVRAGFSRLCLRLSGMRLGPKPLGSVVTLPFTHRGAARMFPHGRSTRTLPAACEAPSFSTSLGYACRLVILWTVTTPVSGQEVALPMCKSLSEPFPLTAMFQTRDVVRVSGLLSTRDATP